jgi:hypothetical protein
MGTDPSSTLEGWRVAYQIELRSPRALHPGSENAGPRNLRLFELWAADEVGADEGGRISTHGPARRTNDPPVPESMSAAQVVPARLPAVLVMRQLLEAWRAAERQLAAAVEDSLERSQVQTQVATLRSLYQGLFVQVRYSQIERAETEGW